MNTKFFYFLFFIFLITNVSCATLTMSPTQINFNEETNCQKINLKLEGQATLIGSTFWAEENYFERKLSKHTFASEEVGIDIEYPQIINLDGKEEIEICISMKKGNYHGVLLYRIEGKPVEVGIWMDANFSKDNFISITGNSIITSNETNPKSFFVITPIIFIVILGILLVLDKGKKIPDS